MLKKELINIIQVCSYYPPHLGGMERVAKATAEGMANLGYKVEVITTSDHDTKYGLVSKGNLSIRSLWGFSFAHTPFAPTLLWYLLTLPKNSLIHFHLTHAYFPEVVLFASKIRKIPFVVHFHLDVEPSTKVMGKFFLVYKKFIWGPVLRHAKKVICCSEEQGRVVSEKFGVLDENIVVIPNAVSDNFFINRVFAPSDKIYRLLYIGRLAIQKKVERIIEAVAMCKIPVHLTIVGEGEDRQKLELLVKSLNLNNVDFVGKKNDAEMHALHGSHDLFIISSDKEGGTPLVVLEAMAASLPVIGTDVSGIRDLLNGTGILVGEPYAQNIANAIEKLWNNKFEQIKLSSLSASKAKFYSWSNFIAKVEDVYLKTLQ